MYLLYDTNLASDWPYLLGVVVIIVGLVLYYQKAKTDQIELKKAEHDAYSHVVNDSNYNINREGMDGHRDQDLSKEEAKQAIDTLKETGQIPTQGEFNELKKDLEK
ncbi:hypothetical protein [Neolewinella antarctica]|uniref:SHOCT domain-containing protein n=1 Tax=Neolewinella antarctica TaxID=442734 RepID=A0ABX0X6U4_9BACT|nr:hypothetical protein [Neolewinella antarctica]NJC24946.1 hypothetical protein [Neolewinella antarctica]